MTVSDTRSKRMWIVLIVAVGVIGGLATWRSAAKMMQMQSGTHAAGSTEFAKLKPGETAKVVLEVVESDQASLEGKILEKEDDTHYKRTDALAHVSFDGSTPVVMGKMSDIRGGAVLHVTGQFKDDGAVQARQIVILTGYVKVD